MNLRERDIALKKVAIELEAIELANEKTKLSLKKMKEQNKIIIDA